MFNIVGERKRGEKADEPVKVNLSNSLSKLHIDNNDLF